MIGKHRTTDGTTMLTADMTDDHLLNLIKLFLNRMMQAKANSQNNVQVSTFARHLYGAPELSEREAADVVQDGVTRLMPYLAEAWLRDIGGEYRPLFMQLLERESLTLLTTSTEDVPF